MKRNALRALSCILLLLGLSGSSPTSCPPGGQDQPEFLIRCDDAGMCHAVNMAVREVIATGIPFSVSVMFACPWYQEAVEVLRGHQNVSVGVHLTLNAEWKNYRWGPVAGRSAVPTLVDSEGYFFPSRDLFFAHAPDTLEVERELRAQIERALGTGLKIDYVDYHMGTAVSKPEMRRVVERLAHRYGLGISRYFGEQDLDGWYFASPEAKRDSLLARAQAAGPGPARLLVFHVGLVSPEMDALEDLNSFGLREMSRHRQAELRALTSPEFLGLIRSRGVHLETYAGLIRRYGLESMRAPAQ